MLRTELLLQRLEAIGQALEQKSGALALLGLGSVGIERERLDEYSDLDFFVIVQPGCKMRFIDQWDWLEDAYPLAYHFQNTADGHKIMFADGIYGEFAVFEEAELENIAYAEGKIVWNAPAYTGDHLEKPIYNTPVTRPESADYPLNEALTNLYVGLCRYARGEKLSALRFVQGHAIDSILSVMHLLEQEIDFYPDTFGNERRFEARFPAFSYTLGSMLQGYENVPESAIEILNYLERVYPVNEKMSAEIRRLAQQCRSSV